MQGFLSLSLSHSIDLELSEDDLCGWDSHRLAASVLVGRWSSCLKVFATAFMDTVGRQSGSVLSEEQMFEQREKEFRREMDHLRTASHKDILLEVRTCMIYNVETFTISTGIILGYCLSLFWGLDYIQV